jgi:hypothetical protein
MGFVEGPAICGRFPGRLAFRRRGWGPGSVQNHPLMQTADLE